MISNVISVAEASGKRDFRTSVLIYEPYIFNVYGNTRYLLSIFRYYDRSSFRLVLCSPYEHPFLDLIRQTDGECVVASPPAELVRYGGAITSDGLVGRLRTAWSILRFSFYLRSVLLRLGIRVVQCHSIRSLLTIGLAARSARLPVLWYVKGDLANGLLDRLGFVIASRVAFQSTLTRDRKYPLLRRLFGRKIRIIRNGIDFSELESYTAGQKDSVRAELGLRSDRTNIIALGQVSPLKGSDLLVSAVGELAKTDKNFHLYFVGDPVLEKFADFYEGLKGRVRAEGLESYVSFLGWRPDATLILSMMDLLVHASLSEGVPKAVIEAMALGVPVVATSVGGTAELVQDGVTGRLIPPANVVALRAAIRLSLVDKDALQRMAKAARARVHQEYSVVDNVRSLQRVYDELSPPKF